MNVFGHGGGEPCLTEGRGWQGSAWTEVEASAHATGIDSLSSAWETRGIPWASSIEGETLVMGTTKVRSA